MSSVLAAPLTKLGKFNFPLHKLLVLPGIIIDPAASAALQFDHILGKL